MYNIIEKIFYLIKKIFLTEILSCFSAAILFCMFPCIFFIFSLLSLIKSTACGITGVITLKHSFAAFGDPGKFIINVLSRIPLTPLINIKHIFKNLYILCVYLFI